MSELGTIGYYHKLQAILNGDATWATLASRITCSMVHAYGDPIGRSFLINFEAGRVTDVAEVDTSVDPKADFVISGPGSAWREVLSGDVKPTTALASGKLGVQGSQMFLLRNIKPFTYLFETMTALGKDEVAVPND
jgi:hypothetical protein